MSRRSRDWNEQLARDLRNKCFAQEFILASLDEQVELKEVLSKVIRAYGLKEFGEKVCIPAPNLVRILSPKSNPRLETLNTLLSAFGLRLTAAPVKRQRAA